jgi:VIT1/CCC1 family predicted Fe2+/Mn2+ transporter/rubrerythrin
MPDATETPVTPTASAAPSGVDRERLLAVLDRNYQEEKEGAATYRALGERAEDEHRRRILFGLAEAEENHAAWWSRRMQELGAPAPVYRGHPHGTADSFANRISGMDGALRRVELMERQHTVDYGRQLAELGDATSLEILREVIADEKAHAKALRRLYRPLPNDSPLSPREALDKLLTRRDAGRRRAGGWIGDAIYGVNDGLGAIFGIVSGVSGATEGASKIVLIAGLAGMVASALSMGAGAYLAAKSEREIYEAELIRERELIRENPDEAHEMLSLIYQTRGVPAADADRVVAHLAADEENFLRAVAGERLNMSEGGLPNPYLSLFTGTVSTAIGALLPILPFFFLTGYAAIIVAAVVSLAAHFAVGAAKSLITVRPWWSSGWEMTWVGALEGVVTYLIGLAIGGGVG